MKNTEIKLFELFEKTNIKKSTLTELFGDTKVRVLNDVVDNDLSGYGLITTTIIEVNPTIAENILKLNTNNRDIKPQHVSNIAKSFTKNSKKYKDKSEAPFNGDAIVISANGVQSDGQQRLMAVIASGVSVPFAIMIGVSDESILYHDIQPSRNSSLALKKNNIGKASMVASIVKQKFAYLHDLGLSENVLKYPNRTGLTNEDVQWFYENDSTIDDSIDIAYGLRYCLKGLLSPSQTGSIHNILLMSGSEEKVDYFIKALGDGLGMQIGSPIIALRNLLLRVKNDDRYHLSKGQILWSILHAWNKFISGCQISRINPTERTSKSEILLILDYLGNPIDTEELSNRFYNI